MTRKKIDVFGLVLTSACLLWAIILCIVDFDWWTFGGALFVAGLIVLTWILIRRSKPLDHKHPNNHFPDVAEGSKPPTMKGGGPIRDFVKWYAVTHGPSGRNHTIEEAEAIIHGMSPWRLAELRGEHDAYLALNKFRNYPRP